jgi:predicted adenylyl cyclase CyaB
MARNIEIKARVESLDHTEALARTLACDGPFDLQQDDTFFVAAHGRLKLRVESRRDATPEARLIFYRRPDRAGPKTSFYVMTPTADPDGLREALTLAHGSLGRVRKRRRLYLIGRTRVHLDQVEGLGSFVELEVVLAEDEAESAGVEEAHRLLAALSIETGQLVEAAYLDLLADAQVPSTVRTVTSRIQ